MGDGDLPRDKRHDPTSQRETQGCNRVPGSRQAPKFNLGKGGGGGAGTQEKGSKKKGTPRGKKRPDGETGGKGVVRPKLKKGLLQTHAQKPQGHVGAGGRAPQIQEPPGCKG